MARGFCGKDKGLETLQTDIKTAIVSAEIRTHTPRAKTIQYSGLSESGFYNCMRHPERFRVETLYKIYEGLRIPQEVRRFG